MSTVVTPSAFVPSPPPPPENPFYFGWRYVQVTRPKGDTDFEQIPLTENDVLHPQEGDFIMNTPLHHRIVGYLRAGVEACFEGDPTVLVMGDSLVDWGVPQGWVHGPDIGVFFDVKQRPSEASGTFRVRESGGRPSLLIEATSPSTRGNDYGPKKREYFDIGVPLYVIVDLPDEGKVLGPITLYGYQAGAKQFVPLVPDERGRLWLAPIGLWLGADCLKVYLEDSAGNRVPDYRELSAKTKQLEAENARLRSQNPG